MAFEAKLDRGQPRSAAPVCPGVDADRIRYCLPEAGNKGYDVRGFIGCMVDRESMFELETRQGRAPICARVRMLRARSRGADSGKRVERTWRRTR